MSAISKAIDELADLFEHGHLEAASDPFAFIRSVTAEVRTLRARVAELERERDYVQGYAGDLRAIDKVLDEHDAPHDPEDGASLSPRRIKLLAHERDDLRARVAELERERNDVDRLLCNVAGDTLLAKAEEAAERIRVLSRERDKARAAWRTMDGVQERMRPVVAEALHIVRWVRHMSNGDARAFCDAVDTYRVCNGTHADGCALRAALGDES